MGIKKILKLPFLLYLKMHEHLDKSGMKYLRFNRGSKTLAIVFSAFDAENKKRAYNYVKSLANTGVDILFFSDVWGFRGSYYLKDAGDDAPRAAVLSIVNQELRGGYSKLITLGTSKGGSAAIYYGLELNASDIISGACQYNIGSYVANYPEIFKGMTGREVNEADIEHLDFIMPEQLSRHKDSKTKIHLIHSRQESTYERDIQYLIHDLNTLHYDLEEIECGFKEHSNVAKYFIPYAKDFLTKHKSTR